MKAVFLDKKTFDSELSISNIKKQTSAIECFELTTPDDIVNRSIDAEIIITNKVKISEKVLEQLPKLKLICVAATGTNNVDINAAKALSIAVTNVAGYAKHSVAQYVFATLLEVMNKTSHHINNTRLGNWQKSETFCLVDSPIAELAGQTLGLIGYGAIAKQVESIALAFGMRVLIAERLNSDIRPGRIAFNDVLAQSDIISIHCPLDETNQYLFNTERLQKMKKGSILINTARGGLIDDIALLEALKSEHLAYAIIDVLDQEPPSEEHPLIKNQLDNLLVTAHVAWASLQAQQALLDQIGENIKSYQQQGSLNRIC